MEDMEWDLVVQWAVALVVWDLVVQEDLALVVWDPVVRADLALVVLEDLDPMAQEDLVIAGIVVRIMEVA
jgi:hypothetical protein